MAPYNAIHVGAAAHALPDALVDQLACPGRLIVPVENPSTGAQYVLKKFLMKRDLVQVDKDSRGEITKTVLFGVMVRTASNQVCTVDRCPCAAIIVAEFGTQMFKIIDFRKKQYSVAFLSSYCSRPMHAHGSDTLAMQISASSETCMPSNAVVAHLMPFHIEYTGPAPIDTYFLWDKAESRTDSNADAVAAFRGRKVYGTRLDLPLDYNLGFFMLRQLVKSHNQSIAPKRPITRPEMRTVMPPKPIRGSRFSMSDEEEEIQEPDFAWQAQGLDSTSEFDTSKDQELSPYQITPAEQDLHLVASAGRSLWIWNPDGPLDTGDDVYIRTSREWLSIVATAVRNMPLTQLHTFP